MNEETDILTKHYVKTKTKSRTNPALLMCTNSIIETSVIDFALVFFYIKNYILNKKIYRKEQYE